MFKKGDQTDLGNCRGNALSEHSRKGVLQLLADNIAQLEYWKEK